MRKGLFWGIFDQYGERKPVSYTAICDENGTAKSGQPIYNSKKGNSYSHERTWPLLTEKLPQKIRERTWNYYPRGRVEIANGKATVYFNPAITEWLDFQ